MPRELLLPSTHASESPTEYVGIHGHLHQPPREAANGQVRGETRATRAEFGERSDDKRAVSWNDVLEKLTYGPNARADNYERMSFNLSPTLANYLERYHPDTYQRLVSAPERVEANGEPHNVLGMPYFHAIMPLLPERDQHTLISWGDYDVRARFGVEPEGIWVPEMAMNRRTLAIAREHGYRWTYAFPWQLEGPVGTPAAYETSVSDTEHMRILPENSHDYVWGQFYNGNLEQFYADARTRFTRETCPQMLVKATDGEHLQNELVGRLAAALDAGTQHVQWRKPTTYMADVGNSNQELPGVDIVDNSAGEGTLDSDYSRTHTLERWTGVRHGETVVGWKQELQTAYREFSDSMDVVYEEGMAALGVETPWEMRDDYIRLLEGEVDEREFFSRWGPDVHLSGEERRQALKLMASQYHKLAASSSCGWFFDKPSGVEPKIVTRQMRIAIEHLRTSNLAIESESGTATGERMADTIEAELLQRLHVAADEKARLSRVYKRLGVASVRSLVIPPQYRQ